MAQVQLPLLVPADGGDGLSDLSFGLLYDDVSMVLLGVYGHNATNDDLYLRVTLDTAPFRVFDITLEPGFPYTERLIPAGQRLSMRELPDDKGGTKLVPPIVEIVKERRYANPRRSSPVVLSVTESQNAASSTTHNATMPATVDAGDGLATWIIFGQPDAGTLNTPSGWTKIPGSETSADDGANFVNGAWFGKAADGSEDGASVDFSTSASCAFIAQTYRIEAGSWTGDVADWEASTPVQDFDGSIDPSNIVYSGSAGDHLYLVGAGTANDSVTSTGPSGWTGTSEDMNSTNDLHARSAYLVVNDATNADPGAMTFDADSHIASGIVVPETPGALLGGGGHHAISETAISDFNPDVFNQTLSGALYSNVGTFPTGNVFPDQFLDGALYSNVGVFNTGAVTSNYNLQGALFTNVGVFTAGTITTQYLLSGALYSNVGVFPTGAVTTQYLLSGALFSQLPSFFQGAITSNYALSGQLFSQLPTFFAGTVTPGNVTLAGVLFTQNPTFFAGSVSQLLSGQLFNAPGTFFAGTISPGGVTVSGVLYTNVGTFNAGAITTQYQLAGNLFSNIGVFNTGLIETDYLLSGALFSQLPSFFQGVVTSNRNLLGQLFTNVGTFNTGTITPGGVSLAGVLFDAPATFFQGLIAAAGNNLFGNLFNNVGVFSSGTVSPGGIVLAGSLFDAPGIFTAGVVTPGGVFLAGQTFDALGSFQTGMILPTNLLAGNLIDAPPIFFGGSVELDQTLLGQLLSIPPEFFVGVLTGGVVFFGTIGGLRTPHDLERALRDISRNAGDRVRTPLTIVRSPRDISRW